MPVQANLYLATLLKIFFKENIASLFLPEAGKCDVSYSLIAGSGLRRRWVTLRKGTHRGQNVLAERSMLQSLCTTIAKISRLHEIQGKRSLG